MNKIKSISITCFIVLVSFCFVFASGICKGKKKEIGASLCVGGELFCTDFETGNDPVWDATNGTEDCDGYDTDGDYCDDDTTTYKNGAEAFGAQGANTYYVEEALSSADQTSFYIEGWWRIDDTFSTQSGPGVYNSAGYQVAVIDASYGTIRYVGKGGSTVTATSGSISADTWLHFGLYNQCETGDGSGDDGIVRIWINTDGSDFDAGDVVLNNTAMDNGSSSEGYNGDTVRFVGPRAGYIAWTDDPVVKSGAPSWAYE